MYNQLTTPEIELEKEMEGAIKLWQASKIIGLGYRKIPENAVVLTREEYERLCDLAYFGSGEEEVRKETAEKFAERLKAIFNKSREYYEIDTGTAWSDGQIGGLINDKIDEILKEITGGEK